MRKRKRESRIVETLKEFHRDERSGIMNLSNYVTTAQAADLLGVGQRHILHLLTTEKVKGIKLGHDWIVFVPSIQNYLKTKSAKGRPPSGTPQLQEAS